ncbi:hypothetical protein C8R46DRAFT_1232358 [Mycena filopes]|nr:hypothetical protein C8R46DRAFT_1232358 [Mycena filopes]
MASRTDRNSEDARWDSGQRIRVDNRGHPYNNYEGGRNRGHNLGAAENTHNRAPRGMPPSRHSQQGANDPPRIIDNPNLSLSQASSTAVEDDDCPAPDPRYAKDEEERILWVRERPIASGNLNPALWREANPSALGLFHRCRVTTLEQAYNLISFLGVGQMEAHELYTQTVQNFTAFPTSFRTEGEAHLMRYQQDIDRAWWVTTTGTVRPLRHEHHPHLYKSPRDVLHSRHDGSEGTSNPLSLSTSRRRYGPVPQSFAPPAAASYAFGSAGMVRPAPSTTAVATRATTPAVSADNSRGYLGQSPPNPEDTRPEQVGDIAQMTPANTLWTAGELGLV